MKLSTELTINADAKTVWNVLGVNYANADEWLSQIEASYEAEFGTDENGDKVIGRVCEFTPNSNGAYSDEQIFKMDDENMILGLHVFPRNSGKIPVIKSESVFQVIALDENTSKVTFSGDIELKTVGKILSPAIKIALKKSFFEILDDLKYFIEEGHPHPRKQKKLARKSA